MPRHVDDGLYTLLLGTLPEGESHRMHLHLSSCARCTAHLAQARDDLALLSLALAPAQVPPWLREGLTHTLGEVSRFTDMMPLLSERLMLPRAEMEVLLDRLDRPQAWAPTAAVGIQYLTRAGHSTEWFRAVPGVRLQRPWSRSPGEALIVQGCCRNACGITSRVGESVYLSAALDVHALAGPDVLYVMCCEPSQNEIAPPAARALLETQLSQAPDWK